MLVVEALIAGTRAGDDGRVFDVIVLVVTDGPKRTRDQYATFHAP